MGMIAGVALVTIALAMSNKKKGAGAEVKSKETVGAPSKTKKKTI